MCNALLKTPGGIRGELISGIQFILPTFSQKENKTKAILKKKKKVECTKMHFFFFQIHTVSHFQLI